MEKSRRHWFAGALCRVGAAGRGGTVPVVHGWILEQHLFHHTIYDSVVPLIASIHVGAVIGSDIVVRGGLVVFTPQPNKQVARSFPEVQHVGTSWRHSAHSG
jgi:hypothetical protein